MGSRRRPTIGFATYDLGQELAADVWAGVAETARESDSNLISFVTGDAEGMGHVLYDLVDVERVDGLVMFQWWRDRRAFEAVYDRYRPLPVVNVMSLYDGYPGVAWDNRQSVSELVTHLIEVHRYRRIAFAGYLEGNSTSEEQYRAYVDALFSHGIALDPDLAVPADEPGTGRTGRNGIRLLMDDRRLRPRLDFEALIMCDDTDALEALTELRERGVDVPYDVAVVGVGDLKAGAASIPPLTTVAMPSREMGRRAAEMLLSRIAGGTVPERVILPTSPVIRRSCGCVDPAVMEAVACSALRAERSAMGPFLSAMRAEWDQIASDMTQAAWRAYDGDEWVEGLLEAFVAALASGPEIKGGPGRSTVFVSALDRVLRKVEQAGGDVNACQNIISAMRCRVLPYLLDDDTALRHAEDLWQQGRIFIGQVGQQVQARERARMDRQAETMRAITAELLGALDTEVLGDVLARQLPKLGIQGGYVSLYTHPDAPTNSSRLLAAFDERGPIELDSESRAFPSTMLVPQGLLPDDRPYSLVVEPLYSAELQLGLAVFHAGSPEGTVYKVLREQVSSALWNARLLRDLARRNTQLQTASQVSRAVGALLGSDDLIREAVELIRERFGFYYVGLFLVDETRRWAILRAGTGTPGSQMLARGHRLEVGGESMIGQCVARGQARNTLDVGQEVRRFDNPLLPDTRSEVALPLLSRGETLGAITIQSTVEAAFTEEDIAALQTMADHLAVAIGNARLFEETQVRAEEMAVLNEMSRALPMVLDVDEVIQRTCRYASRLMDTTNFYVALYDVERDEVSFPFYAEGDQIRKGGRRQAGHGMTEYVIRIGQPLLLMDDIAARLEGLGIESIGREAKSWLGVPMMVGDRVIGMMAVQSYTTAGVYNEHHRDLLSAIAQQTAAVIESAMLLGAAETRAERERAVRTITDRIRRGMSREAIVHIALEELGTMLGAPTSVVRLGTAERLLSRPEPPVADG